MRDFMFIPNKVFTSINFKSIQLASDLQKMLPSISQEVFEKYALAGVKIAWDMLMFTPPAIACTPIKFTDSWHEDYGPQWDDEKSDEYLVYFRPLLLLGAGGTVGSKALVGNIMPSKHKHHSRDHSVIVTEGVTPNEVCYVFLILY